MNVLPDRTLGAPSVDLLVVGGGPAAVSLAAASAAEGLKVRLISPEPLAGWTHNYGAWSSEIEGLFPEDPGVVEATWLCPRVSTSSRPELNLGRRYARLDTARLQQLFADRCLCLGVDHEPGQAVAVSHGERGSAVTLSDGRVFEARHVVDATGRQTLLTPGRSGSPGFQSAYGQLIEVEGHPFEPGEMVLMDWRPLSALRPGPELVDAAVEALPTFLYALPLGRHQIFVEETVLVRDQPVSFEVLAGRLSRRLSRMGLRPTRVLSEERCVIPMGGTMPAIGQRTLGFGAAAGMVHPATGYQVARALREAPALARLLATAEGSPAEVSRQAWDTLWPLDRLRQWAVYRFGMGVIGGLDRAGTEAFFDAFFALPAERWQGFLDAGSPSPELLRTMAAFFLEARNDLRQTLARAGASPRGVDLLLRLVSA